MNKAQVEIFYARLQAANPHPTTELHYSSPFQLLIAVILSAQATDVAVNKASERLFADAPTPARMAALGEESLRGYIKTIGLYRSKAKHVIATCLRLLALHGGEVPDDRAALEALPGVGRKTANVVLNTAFGHPTIAVDTHIFRLGNRTGLAPGKTPLAVEQRLLRVTPEIYQRDAHHWLILHGRYICKARKPECTRCVVSDLCRYFTAPPPEKKRPMFNPTRDQVRQFFCSSWKKHLERMPLVGAEVTAADIAARHPEYHALLTDSDGALSKEWTPEDGQMNPFLHLSLHLAIHEQVSIDHPPGIRLAFDQLRRKMEGHAAEHVLLECLGETLWQAQRQGTEMDAPAYVDAIRRKASLL